MSPAAVFTPRSAVSFNIISIPHKIAKAAPCSSTKKWCAYAPELGNPARYEVLLFAILSSAHEIS